MAEIMRVQVQAGFLAQRFLSMPEHERPTAVFSSAWCEYWDPGITHT